MSLHVYRAKTFQELLPLIENFMAKNNGQIETIDTNEIIINGETRCEVKFKLKEEENKS